MGVVFFLLAASMAYFTCLCVLGDEDDDLTKVSIVTFGSVIKLVHVQSGNRLHSHEIPYGSGSGQQSVTAFHSSGDGNSYWIVKSAHGTSTEPAGRAIRCGDLIRLQHVRTATNLHTHDHRAPISRDYEVSAYRVGGANGYVSGDESDDWKIECTQSKTNWIRGEQIRLVHAVSGRFLAADKRYMFSNPIPNQLQVSSNSRKGSNTLWKTDEGFYFVPTDVSSK